MAHHVSKLTVWSCELEDRPGAVSEKLGALADAGANLEFVLARRKPESPGKGILFVAPLKGKKQEDAARSAYFSVTTELAALKLEGPNKAGLAQRITDGIAHAGINLRGLMASVSGNKYVALIAFDSFADAERGAKEIRKIK